MDEIKRYLAEVKARHEATTEGVWKDDVTQEGLLVVRMFDLTGFDRDQNIFMGDMETTDKYDHADARFIAHAHQDVPTLLAMLDFAVSFVGMIAEHSFDGDDRGRATTALVRLAAMLPPTQEATE